MKAEAINNQQREGENEEIKVYEAELEKIEKNIEEEKMEKEEKVEEEKM